MEQKEIARSPARLASPILYLVRLRAHLARGKTATGLVADAPAVSRSPVVRWLKGG